VVVSLSNYTSPTEKKNTKRYLVCLKLSTNCFRAANFRMLKTLLPMEDLTLSGLTYHSHFDNW